MNKFRCDWNASSDGIIDFFITILWWCLHFFHWFWNLFAHKTLQKFGRQVDWTIILKTEMIDVTKRLIEGHRCSKQSIFPCVPCKFIWNQTKSTFVLEGNAKIESLPTTEAEFDSTTSIISYNNMRSNALK